MNAIAMRTTEDIQGSLEPIAELPTVTATLQTERVAGDGDERIAVVTLEDGIERVPPSVCRTIGEGDFGIEMIEDFGDHLEVVLR